MSHPSQMDIAVSTIMETGAVLDGRMEAGIPKVIRCQDLAILITTSRGMSVTPVTSNMIVALAIALIRMIGHVVPAGVVRLTQKTEFAAEPLQVRTATASRIAIINLLTVFVTLGMEGWSHSCSTP